MHMIFFWKQYYSWRYARVARGRSQIASKINQFPAPVEQQILAQMASNNKFTVPSFLELTIAGGDLSEEEVGSVDIPSFKRYES